MPMTKDEFRTAFYLGERWGQKDKSIQDLACNVFGDKIVLLDLLAEYVVDDDMKGDLKIVREILRRRGEALWIMKADTVTNLSIKVGMRVKKISLKRKKKQ